MLNYYIQRGECTSVRIPRAFPFLTQAPTRMTAHTILFLLGPALSSICLCK